MEQRIIKEIAGHMSRTPWELSKYFDGSVTDSGNGGTSRIRTADCRNAILDDETVIANTQAIVSAVNNTYGKGLNPETYEPLRNAATDLYVKFSTIGGELVVSDFDELLELIGKAKL